MGGAEAETGANGMPRFKRFDPALAGSWPVQIFWSGAKAGAPVVVRRKGFGKPKDVRGNAIPALFLKSRPPLFLIGFL